ncbi:hypothetical protein V8G54_027682 [Vigna mungo]|uniref:Ubiquitin-like protease family profile domain-containing protein n=1 Tax=Vigna mungo TaxID=3915 RepID=A0AAQ3N1X1_VIGMU
MVVRIVDPIELNMRLMKQMVRRWVPQHQSFRVRKELVPFNVVDVVMTLGFAVGGLEVRFDESIVGIVSELFNSTTIKLKDMINIFYTIVVNEDLDVDVAKRVTNIPCLVLDDLDTLCNYDWSTAIHTYLVRSLHRCNKKILTGAIEDSLSISGAVVALQLWVYERLCLHGDTSLKVFSRLLRFRLVDYETDEIDVLLKKGEVQFEWYLSPSDHQNPIIRSALNLDPVGRSEEAAEKGDDSFESAVATRVEKIRRNNLKIRTLKDEIVALRKQISDGRKTAIVDGEGTEEAAGDAAEEAAHDGAAGDATQEAAHDETAVDATEEAGGEEGAHREPAPEEAAPQETAPEEGTQEEVGPHEEGADEVAGPEKGAYEEGGDEEGADEELGDEEPLQHPPLFIDMGDDEEDEVKSHAEPMVVEPLDTFVGDPRATVIIFAATMFMYFEKRLTRFIKRMIFSPMFAVIATYFLEDNKKRIVNRHVWQVNDYQPYFRNDLVRVQDLLPADWVFIPVVSGGHWWCYALQVCTTKFFVIDSLEKGIRGRVGIDRSIAKNIQQFWSKLSNTYEDSKIDFNVIQAKIPVQPNTYDCGVIMMKVFEISDGDDKYDGKSMPNYTNVGKLVKL